MHFGKALSGLALTGAALGLLAGCSSDDKGEPIELNFAAKVGTLPFNCSTTYENVDGVAGKFTIKDFRFYVHDVVLIDTEGARHAVALKADGLWQHEKVALLDFEDKSGHCANGTTQTNTKIVGTWDGGADIEAVEFKIGVPFELNHAQASEAPSPLNLSGLFWSWQGGYKFLRIDVDPVVEHGGHGEEGGHDSNGHGAGFSVHLGSTGCGIDENMVSTGCAQPNRGLIRLSGFDLAQDTIALDVARLLDSMDITMDGGGSAGCISGKTDPECGVILPRLGVNLETGEPSATEGAFVLE